jgi:hypothetical protein
MKAEIETAGLPALWVTHPAILLKKRARFNLLFGIRFFSMFNVLGLIQD